jgi:hypothetical protein
MHGRVRLTADLAWSSTPDQLARDWHYESLMPTFYVQAVVLWSFAIGLALMLVMQISIRRPKPARVAQTMLPR